jgi:hypothetical protein
MHGWLQKGAVVKTALDLTTRRSARLRAIRSAFSIEAQLRITTVSPTMSDRAVGKVNVSASAFGDGLMCRQIGRAIAWRDA